MSIPLKLPLTLAAANWIVKQGRDYASIASWDAAADGLPPAGVGDPIYVAIIPRELTLVPMSSEALAATMRRRFDPQESSPWVFTPGLEEGEVWIVHTKRIPSILETNTSSARQ